MGRHATGSVNGLWHSPNSTVVDMSVLLKNADMLAARRAPDLTRGAELAELRMRVRIGAISS